MNDRLGLCSLVMALGAFAAGLSGHSIPGGEAERMTFADMLDERGIRQSQIARAAGLTRQRVNEWVRGVRDPRLMALGTARRVADALEMTIDEFESRL